MKNKAFRMISMIIIISLLVAMNSTVFAAAPENDSSPQASYYISSTYASVSGGDGAVKVYFDIGGTGKMTSLGATTIMIKNSSGTTIKTYYSSSTSGMMGYNKSFHSGTVTYTGATKGAKYYAVVYFKSADSTGYDTASFTTGYTVA